MFCTIALLSPPFGDFTYSIPSYIPLNALKKGLRVAVPFGNGQLRLGIIVEIKEEHGLQESTNIKSLVWLVEKETLLSEEIILLVEELSARQAQTRAQIYANILPQGLRTMAKLVVYEYQDGARPYKHSFKDIKNYPDERCSSLFHDFLYTDKVELRQLGQNNASYEICRLLQDPPWSIRPNALKQKELLEYLFNNGDTSRNYLQKIFGKTALTTLTSLAKNGIIGIFPQESEDSEEEENKKIIALLESTLHETKPIFTFSPEQTKAIEESAKALENEKFEVRLIHGVTGSGKTALYLELTRRALLLGKSVFLLAPEVALALKLKKDVQNALPQVKNYVSHGYQSPLQRAKIYSALAHEEEACIIIGTRSALFHSLHKKQNIGLIVLDEEHDSSYKQDEKFFYHAKEIAMHRAKQHNALLLLGSATPDIKTFYSANHGHIAMDTLLDRVGGGALPEIELVDISDSKNVELLSPRSLELLKECLIKDEQAVILLNRRGYSPIVYCLDCKKVQRCPHCSIALSYHKKREVLTCHYCNFSRPFPSPCSECRGLHFLPLGDGTEKLEEQLNTFLNSLENTQEELKILRLDRDSTRRQGSMEDILARFARKEAHILIGTQMLSKGHHFPHVSLAIIADADLTLNFPDYRAAERTFQLLVQSAGRAGRETKHGKVIIQTRDTNHYCWKYIEKHDYNNFYAYELALREKHTYPPFTKLALLRLNFPMDMEDFPTARNLLSKHLRHMAKEYNVRLLGPVESPLARLHNVLRYQCLVKADDWRNIRLLYLSAQQLQAQEKGLKEVRILLDLDPVHML